MTTKTLTRDDLAHFTGSETLYRHGMMRRVFYTEGVQHVAEHGGAYWLTDKIAIMQLEPKVHNEPFQCWKLKRTGDKATIVATDGNDNTIHSEQIEFTDFPLDEIELWVEQDADHAVILLPSEH